MTLTRRDLDQLWLPCLAMLAMLAVAAFMAWHSQQQARQAEQELRTASQSHAQAEQRLRQIRTEEQEIRDRSATLQQLKAAGILGAEQRLDWMEMLAAIQRDLRIPGMKYEFSMQTPLNGSPGWYASTLHMQLRLLHEGDLLNFLERIERQARAMVVVRSCKLLPLTAGSDAGTAQALLAAECDMQWLTAQAPGSKP